MSNIRRNVFYIGVTSDIGTRVWHHKSGEGSFFTRKYNCHYLVYYEEYNDIRTAIAREKQLKEWRRLWKVDLIKKANPTMEDISAGW